LLPVRFTPGSNFHHDDEKNLVLDLIQDPVLADANSIDVFLSCQLDASSRARVLRKAI
jgi:hypothetical protein